MKVDQEETNLGDIDAKGRRNWTNEGDLRSIPKGGSFSCSLAANEWEGVTGSYTPQCTLCSYNTCSYTTQIDKHKYTNTETQIHKYNANEWEWVTGSYTPKCTVCSYVAFKIQQCQLNKTITSTIWYSQCNTRTGQFNVHSCVGCKRIQWNTIGRPVIFVTDRYTIHPDYTIKHLHISQGVKICHKICDKMSQISPHGWYIEEHSCIMQAHAGTCTAYIAYITYMAYTAYT